jgi:mycothiol synthase
VGVDQVQIEGTNVRAHIDRRNEQLDVTLSGDLGRTTDAPAVTQWISVHRELDEAVHLITDHPPRGDHPLPGAVADCLGLTTRRELLQLRRPFPAPPPPPGLELRPFDPHRDSDAWIRCNNRAFVDHPDQGSQTLASLHDTLAEPWVDLAGFLVADDPDRPGELAGSCWTKVHPAAEADPVLGEIFVVGVDPSHHGHGLGARLVLAGLAHLAQQSTDAAMLYVEHDNAAARALYERLGFTMHHRRCLYLP